MSITLGFELNQYTVDGTTRLPIFRRGILFAVADFLNDSFGDYFSWFPIKSAIEFANELPSLTKNAPLPR